MNGFTNLGQIAQSGKHFKSRLHRSGWLSPLSGIGILLIAVLVWIGLIFFRLRAGAISQGRAELLISIGGVFATLALAGGIYIQAHQNENLVSQNEVLVENSVRQTTISQESEWIPEFRQPMQANWLLASKNRPWYPWFKVEVENGGQSGWDDEVVRLNMEREEYEEIEKSRDLQWHEQLAKEELSEEDADWYIPFPDDILNHLRSLDTGLYEGKLYFRFKSTTDEEYYFIFHIQFIVHDGGFRIEKTPYVNRIMPWFDSDERDRLRSELIPVIEESRELDSLRERYPDHFLDALEGDANMEFDME